MNIVGALLARGAQVRATYRRTAGAILLRRFGVEQVGARIEEPDSVCRAMDGCEAVFFVAGHYPRYSLDLDASVREGVHGVRVACEAARSAGVERLVYTSSVATLAPAPPGRPADERDVLGTMPTDSVYRATKWAMEAETQEQCARGLDVVTMLPGGCLGPWDVRIGTGGFLVATIRGVLPFWVDGVVNMVDVADVAEAHVAALGSTASARWCVAGHDVQVRSLLATVITRYGGTLPIELSAEDARERAERDERQAASSKGRVVLPREIVDLVTSGQPVSSARAEAALGIRFRPLENSLDRAHEWFVRSRLLPDRRPEGCAHVSA